MKTRLFALLLAICSLGLVSCEKIVYEYEELHPQTVVIDVPQNKWQYSYNEDNNYFYATVNMPEITKQAFESGLVKMYRLYDGKPASQMELPYVRLNEIVFDDGETYFYTETVDYEFSVGSLTIYYTASDFDYELNEKFVPDPMSFRCVIYE